MPELLEPIETLNSRLAAHYGIDTNSLQPIWRIVWSEDQFEKRLTRFTPEGLELLTPIIRELPKYRQWVQSKYILERLVIIPESARKELVDKKINYEPIWTYMDGEGKYLPPKWEATKFIIDCVLAAQFENHNLTKYKEPIEESNTEEGQEIRTAKLQAELFGNETDTGDALAHKEAIVVPRSYEHESVIKPTV